MLDIGRLQLVSFSLAIVQLDRLECKMNGSSINILSIRHLIMHIKIQYSTIKKCLGLHRRLLELDYRGKVEIPFPSVTSC